MLWGDVILNNKRYITKMTLYLNAIKRHFVMGILIGSVFTVLVLLGYFFGNTTTLSDVARVALTGTLPFALFSVVFHSYMPVPGMYRLAKQEKFLGFRFREEMEKYHISKPACKSRDWFIDISKSNVIVFRRDFIVSIGETNYRILNDIFRKKIIVVGADGERYAVTAHHRVINDFRKWFSDACQQPQKL